ncbi:interleukin-10 receptor subunit alpha [Triplophysa rosa]|uniref:Interleukin-10 receptor 1 n=1 Tax=Triplophysa rosa TaxID=992332 RepID=A0A9W7WIA1_TRIRA|nr:interleukin-10 receptor subunit alpha [Triplophysa rosa]KAI7800566.1 interleukin-10 receptor 1 [Triplophysa rosa]
MDFTSWICVLVMWTQIGLYAAGADQKIEVNYEIWEGNATVFWDPPDGAPPNALYQVQQSKYVHTEWHIVPDCNMTKETTCYLGNLISLPEEVKVKVGLFQGNSSFSWSSNRRIRLVNFKLLAPEFHLSSTTKSVKVTNFRKQFLAKLFDFGPRYTVTLYPKGDSQAITQIEDEDEDGEVEFSSLHFLQEYCVNVTVEMVSADVRNSSLQHCIYTSADRSLVISIVTLGVVGTVSFFMFAICFFLRRPGKMPAALKSAVNGWHPMNIGSVHIETITDKGWLLMSNKTEEKTNAPDNTTLFPEEDKERRESTDSGVSVGQQDSIKLRGSDTQTVEDDSGCGSLTGSEDGGRRSMEELPSLDGGMSGGERGEDSGLGMGNRDGSDSLKGADSGLLCEVVVVGDGYRSQSPSADEQGEITVPCDVDSNMVSPSGGYRSGHVTCLCSDFEMCMWCKTRKLVATDCASASHEKTNCTFTTENNDRPSYLKNSEKEVIVLDELNPQSDCESSALLISFPLFHGQNQQLDTSPLTLGDVELTFT